MPVIWVLFLKFPARRSSDSSDFARPRARERARARAHAYVYVRAYLVILALFHFNSQYTVERDDSDF